MFFLRSRAYQYYFLISLLSIFLTPVYSFAAGPEEQFIGQLNGYLWEQLRRPDLSAAERAQLSAMKNHTADLIDRLNPASRSTYGPRNLAEYTQQAEKFAKEAEVAKADARKLMDLYESKLKADTQKKISQQIAQEAEKQLAKQAAKTGFWQGTKTFGGKLIKWGAAPIGIGQAAAEWLKMCPGQQNIYDNLGVELLVAQIKLQSYSLVDCALVAAEQRMACIQQQAVRMNLVSRIEEIKGKMSDIKGFWNQWCRGRFGDL